MTILIEIAELTGYLEERLIEEITTSIELLGIETQTAQVKVLQTSTTTLVEKAQNVISFLKGLDLDFHFANEWDNDEESAAFEQQYQQALKALETITTAYKRK